MEWIKKTMTKIQKIILGLFFSIIGLILLSHIVYRIWIGDGINIPIGITISMGIYIFILVWSLSYSNFLNGMGKLKIQAINTITVGILFIPLGIILGNAYGIYGVIVALCLVNLSGAILNTIQFNKIVYKKITYGIWNR
ncbi:MAG: hypothetical protein LIO71_02745 [Ruminococcus sp.]|nr:hypothetical protein [Ruminococcus sp.]